MENKSHLTAIGRKNYSRPCNYLKKEGLLQGRILDYGCGRGYDCDHLTEEGYDCVGYDPHYQPETPEGWFDTVFCTYVLNVLPDNSERSAVIFAVQSFLNKGGKGYLAVRGKVKEGFTTKGTWQGNIYLDLPLLVGNSDFRIYEIENV